MKKVLLCWTLAIPLAVFLTTPVLADQIQMKNGDVLNGAVLSLSTNVLVLKNENLGVINLPRAKVAAVRFGDIAANNSVPNTPATNNSPVRLAAVPPSSAGVDLTPLLRGIRADSNLVQQVQTRFLGDAGPEASAKFNELLDGLSTGKIDINGLRAEAKKAADQLRSLQKDLGPDADDEMNGYLTILDAFLRETAPTNASTNSAPAVKPTTGQGKP